jgi:hypothetical protein
MESKPRPQMEVNGNPWAPAALPPRGWVCTWHEDKSLPKLGIEPQASRTCPQLYVPEASRRLIFKLWRLFPCSQNMAIEHFKMQRF